MDQILDIVSQILGMFGEFDAAQIVDLFKNFDFSIILDFINSILALFGITL